MAVGQGLNNAIDIFDASCFDGIYCTGESEECRCRGEYCMHDEVACDPTKQGCLCLQIGHLYTGDVEDALHSVSESTWAVESLDD